MYLKNLLNEIKIWRKVKKIAKANEESLNKKGFRVDWIGRIYTVINLPEEVASHNPEVQQMYVLQELREFDKIFLEIGIADYVVPEFRSINETSSYLLILSPDRDYFKLIPFVLFLLKTGLVLVGIRLLYVLINHQYDNIISIWNKAVNLVF